MLPFFGLLADKASSKIVVPAAFLVKGFAVLMLYTVDDPNSWKFYAFATLIRVMAPVVVILCCTYTQTMYPAELRGTLFGIQTIFVSFGGLIWPPLY